MSKPRPKHLDLTKIRFPVTAIVSGMHRISGTVLFLFIPLLLWLLQQSLATPESFEAFRSAVSSPLLKLVLLGLLWAYLHHLCAGIRHLALDLDCGTDIGPARATSKAVLIVSIGLTLVAGAMLW
jgi:succinate dehydrogenase / fumarate reductase cytochrome b subunit